MRLEYIESDCEPIVYVFVSLDTKNIHQEFEQRGIIMETLQHVFPLHQAHPPPVPPTPAQGPPSSHVLHTPQMPDSPGEAHVVVDLRDTSEIIVVSSDDEPMEGFESYLKEKYDPEEDQEIDEAVVEQQVDHEVDKTVREQQVNQEVDEVEAGVSDSSFNSGEESDDEFDAYYDLSRDCYIFFRG